MPALGLHTVLPEQNSSEVTKENWKWLYLTRTSSACQSPPLTRTTVHSYSLPGSQVPITSPLQEAAEQDYGLQKGADEDKEGHSKSLRSGFNTQRTSPPNSDAPARPLLPHQTGEWRGGEQRKREQTQSS